MLIQKVYADIVAPPTPYVVTPSDSSEAISALYSAGAFVIVSILVAIFILWKVKK